MNRIAEANRNNYGEEDLLYGCEQIYLKPHLKSYQLNSINNLLMG